MPMRMTQSYNSIKHQQYSLYVILQFFGYIIIKFFIFGSQFNVIHRFDSCCVKVYEGVLLLCYMLFQCVLMFFIALFHAVSMCFKNATLTSFMQAQCVSSHFIAPFRGVSTYFTHPFDVILRCFIAVSCIFQGASKCLIATKTGAVRTAP